MNLRPLSRPAAAILALTLYATPIAAQESNQALPEGVTQEMIEAGREIFTGPGLCLTCHGENARGTALAPDLTDDAWLNIDGTYEEIVNLVTNGVAEPEEHPTPMPAKGGSQITDEQIRQVAAYVWSLRNEASLAASRGGV